MTRDRSRSRTIARYGLDGTWSAVIAALSQSVRANLHGVIGHGAGALSPSPSSGFGDVTPSESCWGLGLRLRLDKPWCRCTYKIIIARQRDGAPQLPAPISHLFRLEPLESGHHQEAKRMRAPSSVPGAWCLVPFVLCVVESNSHGIIGQNAFWLWRAKQKSRPNRWPRSLRSGARKGATPRESYLKATLKN